jgi:prepilin-type N-terminal cleavage/methylation domain-containing protein
MHTIRRNAFTLIELLVVIAITAILIALCSVAAGRTAGSGSGIGGCSAKTI